MSNRRRAQRRDAHGAPVRTRQEIVVAIGAGLSVVVVTVVLLFVLKHEPPSTGVVTTPSASVPSSSTPAVSDSTATDTTATTATTAPSTTSTSAP
jgi:hypothetical protein